MMYGTETDLGFFESSLTHIETCTKICTKKLELKAVEGRLVGYSSNSDS